VLQALNTPVIHREVVNVKKYKSGRVKTTTTILEVTGAHIVAYLLGRELLELFKSKLPEGLPTSPDVLFPALGSAGGLLGTAAGAAIAHDPQAALGGLGQPGASIGQALQLYLSALKKVKA